MKKIILILFIAYASILDAQHCGTFEKTTTATDTNSTMLIRDRFGNSFDFGDIVIDNNNEPIPLALPHVKNPPPCNAGMFTLYFAPDTAGYGFAIPANRAVLCKVFADISRLIHDVNPSWTTGYGRARIWIASDSTFKHLGKFPTPANGTVLALASAFEVYPRGMSHTLIDNEVAKTIKGGINSYAGLPNFMIPPNAPVMNSNVQMYHGYMAFNFNNLNWHTNFLNDSVDNTERDLYTTALHEALHLLGLTSMIKHDGSSKLGSNIYSLYDQFLTVGSSSTTKLITHNTTNNTWNYTGGMTNLATAGCGNTNSIHFNGDNLTSQSVYCDTPWDGGSNLSHLSCSNAAGCSGYATNSSPANDYVTAFCSDVGVHHMKRNPNDEEVEVLCDLGYQLKNVWNVYAYGHDPNDSFIYRTYSDCDTNHCLAIGYHDGYYTTQNDTPLTIPDSVILANDRDGNHIDTTHFKVIPNYAGTATYSNGNIIFTPDTNYAGEVMIAYYPKCSPNGQRGTMAYIFLNTTPDMTLNCVDDGGCNLLCNGDFEDAYNILPYANLRTDYNGNTADLYVTQNGTTCERMSYGTPLNGTHNCNVSFQNCGRNTTAIQAASGKQFISLGRTGGTIRESVLLEFHTDLVPANTYELTFLGRTSAANCVKNPIVQFYGDDVAPCPRANGTVTQLNATAGTNGTTDACGFSAKFLGVDTVTNAAWNTYSVTFQPSSDISFLVVGLEHDATNADGIAGAWVWLDDIKVHQLNTPQILIEANPNTLNPCINSSGTIQYTVCMDTNQMGFYMDSILLDLTVPTGVQIDSGDFDSQGKAVIQDSTISNTVCRTLTLHYSLTTAVPNIPYTFKLLANSTNACLSIASSGTTTIIPINNPITAQVTLSNDTPSNGDTISYYIEICNYSTDTVRDLQIIDTLPTSLTVVDTNGFTVMGNILSKDIIIPPAVSINTPYCIYDTITVVLNSCIGSENCVTVSTVQPSCIYNRTCISVNSQNGVTVSLPAKYNVCFGDSALIAPTINSTGQTLTYQWQKDGTDITGATDSTYKAGQSGTYTLIVTVNGCEVTGSTVVNILPLISVTDTIENTTCTAALGSITLGVNGGASAYSYLWSDGNTSKNRTNISAGTYYLTITDTVGCIHVDTFEIISILDTIQNSWISQIENCNLGTQKITSIPSGGTPNYTYSWSHTTNTDSIQTGLFSGTYTVTITDSLGCSLVDSITLDSIAEDMNITAVKTNPICTSTNGSITLTVTSSNAPHSYQWSTGGTTNSISNVDVGSYSVTITDSRGCTRDTSYVLDSFYPPILIVDSIEHIYCDTTVKGSIHLTVSGGGGSQFTYLWTDIGTYSSNPDRTGLTKGDYELITFDSLGCQRQDTFEVDSIQSYIAMHATVSHLSSCVNTDGSIDITTINGGIPPYTYLWNTGETTNPITNKADGTYSVTVTDSKACTGTGTYTINKYVKPYITSLTLNPVYSCDNPNAIISVGVTNGSPPYTYAWSNGTTQSTATYNTAGSPKVYVTVTESTGCTTVDSIVLEDYLHVGTGTSYPNSSSLPSLAPYMTSSGRVKLNLKVHGQFIVNTGNYLALENSEIVCNSGSRITVQTSLGLFNSTLKSCRDTLWKGIEVDGMGAGLHMNSTLVEDAQYGVELIGDPQYSIHNCTFKYNYVGIYYRPLSNPMAQRNSCWSFLNGNTFIGKHRASIKNPFIGMVTNTAHNLQYPYVYRHRSWAGIINMHMSHFFLANCTFKDMMNGVLMYNVANPRVDHNHYNNILYENIPILNNYPNGIAVYSVMGNQEGFTNGGWLVVRGNGKFNSTPDFVNCHLGILSLGNLDFIEDNRMINVDNGIWTIWTTTPLIKRNYLNAKEKGIYALTTHQAFRFSAFHVQDNNVSISPTSVMGSGIGIHALSSPFNRFASDLKNNSVTTSGTAGYGIYITNSQQMSAFFANDFSGNSVNINSPTSSLGGINLSNCNSLRLYDNSVSSNSRTAQNPNFNPAGNFPVGIYLNFTEGEYTCNYMNILRTGMRFTGVCANSIVARNRFYSHSLGLKIDNTASLNRQDNTGNTWFGSYSGGWAAENRQNPILTFFRVGNSAPNKFRPTPRFPANNFFTAGGTGDNDYCANMPSLGGGLSGAINGELREAIIDGELDFVDYDESLEYQNEEALYEELHAIEETLDENSDEHEFLELYDTTAMEDFRALRERESHLYDIDSPRKAVIKSLIEFRDNTEVEYLSLYAAKDTVVDSLQSDIDSLIGIKTGLIDSIQDSINGLLAFESEIILLRVDSLAAMNDAIEAVDTPQIFQKQFNTYFYQTIARGNRELDSVQLHNFKTLAAQCPLHNADAVYRSRAIIRLYDDSTFYDDAAICALSGRTYKSTKPARGMDKSSITCSLAPNPTTHSTQIQFSGIPITPVTIIVSDIMGRTVHSETKILESNRYIIQTSDYSEGIYNVQVFSGELTIFDTRLQVNKD